MRQIRCYCLWLLYLSVLVSAPVLAKYDPSKNYIESPAVAAHYPDPDVKINSPAFINTSEQFTTQAEMENFIQQLTEQSANLRVKSIGTSQQGRDIPLLIFAQPAQANAQSLLKNGKPTVLIIGLQHGNEPAAGEATLAYAASLSAGEEGDVLANVNILIVPRANPDGAENFSRDLANGFNLNRDHLLLTTPEGLALANVFNQYQPEVVLDSHEFTVAARWIDKFAGVQYADGAIQYSTIANEVLGLRAINNELFRKQLLADFDQHGIKHSWYYTTSANNIDDKKVSMGGVGPDIGRNIAGLRNSVSFLLETRGFGIGMAHFKRRVYTHLVAMRSVVQTTADNGQYILENNRLLRQIVINSAGKGEITVIGEATPTTSTIQLLDTTSGEVKTIDVEWMNALEIKSTLTRSRPYAYLLAPSEAMAAQRLQQLGLEVYRVTKPITLHAQQYQVIDIKGQTKFDVTGSVGKSGSEVITVKTQLLPVEIEANNHYFYIPLNQPLANLAITALEPESQSSYLSNHILALPEKVMDQPLALPLYRIETPYALAMVELADE